MCSALFSSMILPPFCFCPCPEHVTYPRMFLGSLLDLSKYGKGKGSFLLQTLQELLMLFLTTIYAGVWMSVKFSSANITLLQSLYQTHNFNPVIMIFLVSIFMTLPTSLWISFIIQLHGKLDHYLKINLLKLKFGKVNHITITLWQSHRMSCMGQLEKEPWYKSSTCFLGQALWEKDQMRRSQIWEGIPWSRTTPGRTRTPAWDLQTVGYRIVLQSNFKNRQ